MSKKLLIAVVIVVLGLSCAYAQQQQAVDEKAVAKAMVEKAAVFLNENGKEKTIAEINKPDGQFVQGELYVFAYDLNAVMLAHPKNPKLIGQSLMDKPDSKGKLFRKEIIDKAKSAGSGWVDYFYLNPQTGKEEAKTTYLKKAGDMVICCGAYR